MMAVDFQRTMLNPKTSGLVGSSLVTVCRLARWKRISSKEKLSCEFNGAALYVSAFNAHSFHVLSSDLFYLLVSGAPCSVPTTLPQIQ